jgi:cell division protein ZipA
MESFSGNLRLLLLLLGAVAIVLILGYTYLKSNTGKSRKLRELESYDVADLEIEKPRPAFFGSEEIAVDHDVPRLYLDEEDKPRRHRETVKQKPPARTAPHAAGQARQQAMPHYFIMNVMARPGFDFSGEQVLETLNELGLQYGEMEIYHCYADGVADDEPVFSVADAMNPGYLKPDDLPGRSLKGLSLFMQLPNPEEGEAAYDMMLDAGKRLSLNLDGMLCDETRSVLTPQTISHHKERISEFNRQSKLV